ncbi:MAG: HAMP domain-containing histidine kinase, partial [Clostridia bacterium]|nr:HAMP domain-containing histidine kinase [Clostridia bacterium]
MRSLYQRLFIRILLILLCSLLILSMALFPQIYRYSETQTRLMLQRSAERIAGTIVLYFETSTVPVENLADIVRSSIDESNAEVLIVNLQHEVLIHANKDRFDEVFSTYTYAPVTCIESDFPDLVIEKGIWSEFGTLGGFYPQTCYTVGVPVKSQTNDSLYGAVLLSTPPDFLNTLSSDLIVISISSLAIAAIAAMLMTYLMTRRILAPINAMSRAATAFSRGDFSSRISISGADEIANLSKAFNEMAANLEKTEVIRQDLVTNITHELKTPMTTISGFVNGILDGTIPPDRQTHYLKIVLMEINRLSRMVSQALLATRLSSGEETLVMRPVDLGEIMRRTLLGFEDAANAKELSCAVQIPDLPTMVKADEDSMVQVLYNLIDNAIKYASPRGYLRVTLRRGGGRA